MTDAWAAANTVAHLLDLRAAETPRAIAFRTEAARGPWRPVTWQDFSIRARKLGRALFAAGMRRGDRLAIIAPVSLEWELLHHAALSMGVAVVGLDAHDLAERIATMAEQAAVTAFATSDPRTLSKIGADRLASVRFMIDLGQRRDASADLPVGLRQLTWADLDALGAPLAADPAPPSANDIATIIFTSGTTGAPKGIAYSHGQVCLAVNAICDAFSFVGHEGRLLCWLPLSNLFQRIVNLAAVRQGAATYLLGDPRRVMDVVDRVSPDIFVGVPRFYEKLYEGIQANIAAQPALQRTLVELAWSIGRRARRYRLDKRVPPAWLAATHWVADRTILRRVRRVMGDRLRCMVTGSAPTPRHLLEELYALGWLVLEAYGLSENVLPMAMNRVDDFRFGSVGRPVPGNEIVVAEDGVIKIRGPGMFSGYLDDATDRTLDADGFYLTGDLGEFDADGYLCLTGRMSELIKTSTGRRVAPAGVEAQLRSVPGIEQALVLGNGRKCLVALCSCTDGRLTEAAREQLEAALRDEAAQVNEHERPRGIALIERSFSIDLGELTPNLKLRRAAIEVRHADLIRKLYDRIDEGENRTVRGLVVI